MVTVQPELVRHADAIGRQYVFHWGQELHEGHGFVFDTADRPPVVDPSDTRFFELNSVQRLLPGWYAYTRRYAS